MLIGRSLLTEFQGIFRYRIEQMRLNLIAMFKRRVQKDSRLVPSVLPLLPWLFKDRTKSYVCLPLEWLDVSNVATRVQVVLDHQKAYSFGPKIDGHAVTKEITLPRVSVREFRNVHVHAKSSAVLCKDKILIERIEGVAVDRCDFSSGFLIAHGSKKAVLQLGAIENISEGIFLGGNGSFNYYHFLLEILPKLQFVDEANLPLLVSQDVSTTPSFLEALKAVVGSRPIVYLQKEVVYYVRRLVQIDSPIACPFNLRDGYVMEVADFHTRVESIKFVRSKLMRISDNLRSEFPKNVFLARKAGRRSYNQEEAYEVAKAYGFEPVFMEELSLGQQIHCISKAEMIVGPTGAAWTNLLFANINARCLCWMAKESEAFSGYSNLACALGVDLRYLTYETGARSTGELYHLPYRLDLDILNVELARLAYS